MQPLEELKSEIDYVLDLINRTIERIQNITLSTDLKEPTNTFRLPGIIISLTENLRHLCTAHIYARMIYESNDFKLIEDEIKKLKSIRSREWTQTSLTLSTN